MKKNMDTGMDKVRSILRNYGIHPAKRFGQSFLEDQNIIKKIINMSDINDDDVVVEIGAGLGLMTDCLVSKAKKVIAVDIDKRMIDVLQDRFKNKPQVEIVQGDILSYNFSVCQAEHASGKLRIIGNIPYNISTQILFRLLEFHRHIFSMVLMFQKEVADRIMASPGSKEYGIPSVIISMYGMPSQIMTVPASCFYPKPKVISAVIKIIMREKPLVDLADDDFFYKVVKIAFSKRRKTILNNLRSADLPGNSEEKINAVLKKVGIDRNRRGETLSVEEFGRLSNALW
jgi:16S rRNA (adenine1518-N6/adenine1519-N6)-dimethyltransferase